MLDNLEVGIMTTVIGMGVVFVVLIVLSFLIKWMNSAVEAFAPQKPQAASGAVTRENVPQRVQKVEAKREETLSPQVVAAITAVICNLTGKNQDEFRFTAIRRLAKAQPIWGDMGTQEIITLRQELIERRNS